MSVLTYQNWPNNSANEQYIPVKTLLDSPAAWTCLNEATDHITIAPKSGRSINLRRWVNPVVTVTSSVVTEGVNPNARQLQSQDYTGTLQRYAELFEVSRVAYDLNPYDAVKGSSERGVVLVARDRERVRYNAAIGGTSVFYNAASITTRATVNGTISLGRLQAAVRAIRGAYGENFTKAIGGQAKFGTSPVESGLYAYAHTDLEPDIRNLPGFRTVAEYPSGTGLPYEFGACQNVRFFTSPEFVPFANGGAASTTLISTGTSGITSGAADVYPIFITATHALTSVALGGGGAKGYGNAKANILDGADKSDPTNERIYIAFDWYDLCLITAQEWCARIEVGATRNPS